uniref:CSON008593 protein n=1 Tax=Culicoides sonorensis TaxID=179676 RepID=A0A336LZK5_CULSO
MLRILSIFAFVLLCHHFIHANTDDLVSEVFGNPPANDNRAGEGGPEAYEHCVHDGIDGECVPFYLCSNDSKLLTGGEGVIDIRFNEDKECKDYLTTCCFSEEKLAEPRKPPSVVEIGCGVRNTEGLGFRIQGAKDQESEFGEFPWMVAILSEEEALGKKVNVYKCGGSLIAPNVVLTGAHCVFDKDPAQLKARLGEWDTQTANELFAHQDFNVIRKVVHENFNSKALYNNVALLVLDNSAVLQDNIGTICLPPQGTKFDGARCTASGWGKDHYGKEGKYQVILKKLDLPIVPHVSTQMLLSSVIGSTYNFNKSVELTHQNTCINNQTIMITLVKKHNQKN